MKAYRSITHILLFLAFQKCLSESMKDPLILELHKAVKRGNDTAVEMLLSEGVPVDSRHTNGEVTPLYLAAERGFNSTMEILLRHGAKVNATVIPSKYTSMDLLSYASYYGNVTAVKHLIAAGADLNYLTTCYRFTPLHLAVLSGSREMVETLISIGAPVNAYSARQFLAENISCPRELFSRKDDGTFYYIFGNSNQGDPLTVAARTCSEEIVDVLLEHGANVNGTGSNNRPLIAAIKGICEKVTIKLLELDADANITYRGTMPIHMAASNGMKTVTEYLVSKGFARQRKSTGATPLHEAADGTIAEILISGGAEIDAVTDRGETPLHTAARNGRVDVVKVLLDRNASLNVLSHKSYIFSRTLHKYKKFLFKLRRNKSSGVQQGISPMSAAAFFGKVEVLSLIINKNRSMLNPINASWPPLHAAVESRSVKTVKFLLDLEANVNLPDLFGLTALHRAILHVDKEIVAILLNNSADVNATDNDGWTPLHIAVMFYRTSLAIPIAKMLIDGEIDVDRPDNVGLTALMWAEIHWHPYFVGLQKNLI